MKIVELNGIVPGVPDGTGPLGSGRQLGRKMGPCVGSCAEDDFLKESDLSARGFQSEKEEAFESDDLGNIDTNSKGKQEAYNTFTCPHCGGKIVVETEIEDHSPSFEEGV